MSRLCPISSVLVAAVLLLGTILAIPADAYDLSDYYGTYRWKGTDRNVNWKFSNGFPIGEGWRARVRDGLNYPGDGGHPWGNWNAMGSALVFNEVDPVNANFDPVATACGDWPKENVVMWRQIDGAMGVIGADRVCSRDDGHPIRAITKFAMMYDQAEDWYSGNGDCPETDFDVWSVATHEWGHVTGFYGPNAGHFPDSAAACSDNPKNTMCSGNTKGTEYKRTIEDDEIGLFQQVYGP